MKWYKDKLILTLTIIIACVAIVLGGLIWYIVKGKNEDIPSNRPTQQMVENNAGQSDDKSETQETPSPGEQANSSEQDDTNKDDEEINYDENASEDDFGDSADSTTTGSKTYYTAEDYVANPSLFVPVWAKERTVPSQMLNFEEKWTQFFSPNGRLMSDAHRGDHVHYPENSTEGFLSAILAGADIVEVDVAVTRDGDLVVMHDDTLTRTTNVTQVRAANPDKYPAVDTVSEWSLAELRDLRLIGTDGKTVTNYVIPTLDEIILLCNNRCFITLDKMNRFDWNSDIMPILKRLNAYRTVMLPYSYTYSSKDVNAAFAKTAVLMKGIKDASGHTSALMSRSYDKTCLATTAKLIEQYGFPKVIRSGEYNAGEYSAYAPYLKEYRVHIECLRAANDTLAKWKQIDSEGYGIIVTNDIFELTKYIQQTYFK